MQSKHLLIAFLVFTLSACSNFPSASENDATTPPEQSGTIISPIVEPTLAEETTQVITLQIWVPPQFATDEESEAGLLFQSRLNEFAERHPGVRVTVRVKAAEGDGSLYHSLGTTANAAPLALPDLIALPNDQMQLAADKSYIYPLTPYLFEESTEDWFDYAKALGEFGDIQFGLPFAGDALVMGYRTSLVEEIPLTWQSALESGNIFAFPAGAPLTIFTLLEYQAFGGLLNNEDGALALSEFELKSILEIYQQGQQSGLLPYWLTQYDTDALSWQAFRENRAQMAVTWYTDFSADPPGGTEIAPLPTKTGQPFTYTRGWVWALSSADPSRHAIAVELAEFLSDSTFLSAWNTSLGYLPTRPSALASWDETGTRQAVFSQILPTAVIMPDTLTLSALSPPLQEAIIGVLKQELTAAEAATEIINEISP